MTTFLPGCRSTSGNRLNHDGVAVEFTGNLRLDKAAFYASGVPNAWPAWMPILHRQAHCECELAYTRGNAGTPGLVGWGARI